MKNDMIMNRLSLFLSYTLCIGLLHSDLLNAQINETSEDIPDYYVAAYIWPSCHDDPMGREVLWPEVT